jgi:diketogulonate reductase-like aldo/keto reductase
MGSSRTFDTDLTSEARVRLVEVLRLFFQGGGTLIDSSPMYGRAESVLGELLGNTPGRERLFAATKVWTDGKHQGVEQMQRSMQRMRVDRFDLMQIHNLRDWQVHLETLIDWKARKRIRLVGVTTSHGRYHDDLEALLQQHPFDFVQLSYSIGSRDVERRLLPLARERGIAVIANRPFQRGNLFRRVKGRPLPAFAGELGITSWAQYFLKYVVSHPAVTCAIPATSKPKHMRDNMGAGFGELPDAATRVRMEQVLEAL